MYGRCPSPLRCIRTATPEPKLPIRRARIPGAPARRFPGSSIPARRALAIAACGTHHLVPTASSRSFDALLPVSTFVARIRHFPGASAVAKSIVMENITAGNITRDVTNGPCVFENNSSPF